MRHGFSLVELSIVLVILGLLTGGILAGQSLIRASELRSVSTDYQRYLAATLAFRDKYFALPGDMANATSFWTSAGGTGSDSTCQNAPTNGTATCDGDGNGIVANITTGSKESFRYWQHLTNAGLIEGNYNGKLGGTLGLNLPKSKINNAYFYPWQGGYYPGDIYTFAGDYGNNIYRFTSITAGAAPFAPEEAWNLDTKLDDGKPGGGSIYTYKGDGTTTFCTTGDTLLPPADANSAYRLELSGKGCALIFLRVF